MTDEALAILAQIILGWLFADFLGGILHFVQDRGFLPSFLDKHIGAPNRLHYSDPLAITRDPSLLNRNWTTWAVAVPVSFAVFTITGASAFWFAATIGGLMSYEVHRWAHLPRAAPAFVQMLQEIGIFQSPRQHGRHHMPPQDKSYCVLTNFLNPILNRIL